MLKKWLNKRKQNKLIIEIEKETQWLDDWVNKTEKVHEDAYYQITKVQDDNSWDLMEAMRSAEGNEIVFQLLLHRQFIGYLAEKCRKTQYKLLDLQHIAPRLGSQKEEYSKKIERAVCKAQMNALVDQFSIELRPQIEQYQNQKYR